MTVIRCLSWKIETPRNGRWCGEIGKMSRSARLMEGHQAAVLSTGARRQNESSG